MVDLATTFCGHPVKNPVGFTSCDFGGQAWLVRRCAEQGVVRIVGKTVHRIDGPAVFKTTPQCVNMAGVAAVSCSDVVFTTTASEGYTL